MKKPRDYKWGIVYGDAEDTYVVPMPTLKEAKQLGGQYFRNSGQRVDIVLLEPHMQNADGEWLPQAPAKTIGIVSNLHDALLWKLGQRVLLADKAAR